MSKTSQKTSINFFGFVLIVKYLFISKSTFLIYIYIYISKGICYCTRCLNNDMILKLKAFYLQNGGSFQNLPSAFDWGKYLPERKALTFTPLNIGHQKMRPKNIPKTPKMVMSQKDIQNKEMITTSKFHTFTNLLVSSPRNVRGSGKKKFKEVEWILFEQPLKKKVKLV